MEGFYINLERVDYGVGPDFTVKGIGEFENITHLDGKNPVGS